ncbi:AfuFlbB beta [Aspergillus lentulus]|uniref:AfuFlbB beta n=1 Tax=Aspergillus lentulus TaxID=293939 RepID=A0ABQ0ZX58_ASPLE|nr:AfuFlbB beta [Aspergillus lentulus]GFF28593.1 AfuFlbB beta [Aspergillus lentulus]GFF49350.1 AfuFlbB beta [Aspergillus lentulus]GFF67088.1 AfuFlbB beta [Aspergillus lentulus]GFF67474.1 AfuFlbB beta [Aspergillus lentulus]GFG05479.1 AfuFlbB beta [Aspergillus lentulus]
MASMNGGVVPVDYGHTRGAPSQTSLKTPTSMSTNFFQFFGGQKKVTRDGQPAKRRGPKPDSRPALTRRQELNRQAQRTHRERKEQYIRSLETEVSRLREAFTQEMSAANLAVVQHREMLQTVNDENAILKELLTAHGIQFEAELERRRAQRRSAGRGFQSSPLAGSSVVSQAPAAPAASNGNTYTTPPTTVSNVSSDVSPLANGMERVDISPTHEITPPPPISMTASSCEIPANLDLSAIARNQEPVQAVGGIFEVDPQLQIDFILTLESPCREHTDYLCRRSVTEADDEDMPFSGHALMATCPPPSYIANTTPEQAYPHKTYDLPHANLTTLLNLSRQLVTEGQITPIMALQCLKNHELYRTLTKDDVKIIIETLNTKVRCYGFGAVVEDFELMDCLSSVLGTKVDTRFSCAGDDTMYS